MNRSAGMVSGRISQRWLLDQIQRGESFVYAAITREGAVKVGVSTNLMNRKKNIEFGGTSHFIAMRPGDRADEKDLHRRLAEHRIAGTREYYYPYPEILPVINEMREWMGLRPLRRKALPRLARCTFHRRVMEARAKGTSVFTSRG